MSTPSRPEGGSQPGVDNGNQRAASADPSRHRPALRSAGRRPGCRPGDLPPAGAHVPAEQDAIGTPGLAADGRQPISWTCSLGQGRAGALVGGDRLPEPLPGPAEWPGGRPGARPTPADPGTLDESVGMASLVVLDSMTPAQRVALILHDVFGYPFADIAEITGRTPAACRQLRLLSPPAASAPRSLPAAPAVRQAAIIRDFKKAWEAGDIGALISLLDPDATVITDGGGLATAALRPIEGGEQIARYVADLTSQAPGSVTILEHTVDGQPGLVARRDGVRR